MTAFDIAGPEVQKLRGRLGSAWLLRGFMLAKLPLALVAGLRIEHIDALRCAVSVPYGWRTTNPFASTYFAALSMAAEMSTGALGLVVVRAAPVPVSILIVGMAGEFLKKATTTTTFVCEDGPAMADAVQRTLETGEPVVCETSTVGRNPDGVDIARFRFTWSFRRKSSQT